MPRNINEALDDPNWKLTIFENLKVFQKMVLVTLLSPQKDKKVAGNKLVFTMKSKADASIKRHKVRFVTKGITQNFKIYIIFFVHVVKINHIQMLLSP